MKNKFVWLLFLHNVFTSQGYFLLQPDIVFDTGDPGISSTRTMEAAVEKVIEMGLVDEKRIGLIGHSWGGYQAAVQSRRQTYLRRLLQGPD